MHVSPVRKGRQRNSQGGGGGGWQFDVVIYFQLTQKDYHINLRARLPDYILLRSLFVVSLTFFLEVQ